MMNEKVTLALPSKGAIAEPTYTYLRDCGLKTVKPNPRQYTGRIPAMPDVSLLYQRVKDVAYKVADGTAQLGITGYDVICENPSDSVFVINPSLGYGHCRLVVAVPEAWVDVETIFDLVEVALDFREKKGRDMRIATTYPHLTRQFMHANHIHHFSIVKADGAIEAAPTIGYADIIVDLTQTGTTLRENHLKQIQGGTITESQACLIGNREALQNDEAVLNAAKTLCEHIDAATTGKEFYQLTIDIAGQSAEDIAAKVTANSATRGLLGPTISQIHGANRSGSQGNNQWFTVTLTVQTKELLSAVNYLRETGATHVLATPVRYIFQESSPTYQAMLGELGLV